MMDALWQELTSGLHDSRQLAQVIIRLVAATLFGAIVGIQRESTRKPAGLRTHILVSLARRPRLRTCFSPLFIGEGTSSPWVKTLTPTSWSVSVPSSSGKALHLFQCEREYDCS